jgi:hypothetical protein
MANENTGSEKHNPEYRFRKKPTQCFFLVLTIYLSPLKSTKKKKEVPCFDTRNTKMILVCLGRLEAETAALLLHKTDACCLRIIGRQN